MAFLGSTTSMQATTSTSTIDVHHHHHHTLSSVSTPAPAPAPSSISNHQNQQELKPFMASSSSSSQQPSSSKTHHNNNQNLDLHHHHHHQQQQQQQQNMSLLNMPMSAMSFPMMQSPPSSSSSLPGTYNMKENTAGAYDLGDLDQALFLYLDGQQQANLHDHGQNQTTSTGGGGGGAVGMKPPTLNIFPSQPMHVDPSSKAANSGVLGGGIQSTSGSPKGPTPAYLSTASNNDNNNNNNNKQIRNQSQAQAEPSKSIKREGNRKGPTLSSDQEGPKTPDPKTLRRLAQNREAARKSRLRKKAYVQQLESSRIRLAQLEQEIQRARAQGLYFGGGGGGEQGIPLGVANISSDAAVFDLEYTRWVEEHHRLTCELRAAVQEHIPENELKMYVDNCLAHYDVLMNLKSMVSKSDVFHLVSGMWKTPAERCFMWIGGFRPSELVKIIVHQIEPLTEQQLMEICGLQQSAQGTEEALSQGLDALNQSLSDVIASDTLSCPPNMANYMGQMALAMNKLSNMETFVRQADSLRHQTLHRLHHILTTRQAARCFLAIAEYFHRLRALSSLWLARPRQDQ